MQFAQPGIDFGASYAAPQLYTQQQPALGGFGLQMPRLF
jgi:hypothetical protein